MSGCIVYRNDPKYWDKPTWANSVDLDQTPGPDLACLWPVLAILPNPERRTKDQLVRISTEKVLGMTRLEIEP